MRYKELEVVGDFWDALIYELAELDNIGISQTVTFPMLGSAQYIPKKGFQVR